MSANTSSNHFGKIGNLRGLRIIKARPRLFLSILLGVLVFLLTPHSWRIETRGLVAWNAAAILYFGLVLHLAAHFSPEKIRLRAKLQDDGAVLTLLFSILAAVMCFVAIAFQLAAIKGMLPENKFYHLLLVGMTIPLAWAFIHSMFALHYAHEFYDAADSKGHGIQFPGNEPPSYWDFIYFAFIIGTSGQTADVAVSCPSIRKMATVHCVFAFFFNITMLGLTINVASSLLS